VTSIGNRVVQGESPWTGSIFTLKTTHKVGERSEACILGEAIRAGYVVSIPFGGGHRYDFILDDGKRLWRIQCKTGRLRDGCVRFNTCSVNIKGKRKSYKNEADSFMVYCEQLEKVYFVPVDKVSDCEAYLRVSQPVGNKNYSRIKWAKDFEFQPVGPAIKLLS
jgi:hypothetical protein